MIDSYNFCFDRWSYIIIIKNTSLLGSILNKLLEFGLVLLSWTAKLGCCCFSTGFWLLWWAVALKGLTLITPVRLSIVSIFLAGGEDTFDTEVAALVVAEVVGHVDDEVFVGPVVEKNIFWNFYTVIFPPGNLNSRLRHWE